jgi:hypothetical protein
VQALSDEQLDQIVMHEQAHLERFDDWLRLVQALVAALAGLHPAVWFINRRIETERESACDDWVVARSGSAARYAACLADAATISAGTFDAARVAPAFRSSAALEARVRRLLDPVNVRTSRVVMPRVAVVMLLCGGAVVAFRASGPVVVFRDGARNARPPAVSPRAAYVPGVTPAPVRTEVAAAGISASTKPATGPHRRTVRLPLAPRNVPAEPQESVAGAVREGSRDDDVAEPVGEMTTLEANHLAVSSVAVSSIELRVSASLDERRSRSREGWGRAVDAGLTIGAGGRRTGTAIAGFFTRAGKAVARSF